MAIFLAMPFGLDENLTQAEVADSQPILRNANVANAVKKPLSTRPLPPTLKTSALNQGYPDPASCTTGLQ